MNQPIPVWCHLLYIAGSDARRVGPVLDTLNGASVFTVGEGDRFGASGGIAELTREHDRMRVAVNGAAAARPRSQRSSTLVGLPKIMRHDPNVQP